MDHISFITTEDLDDLIVSFVISSSELSDVRDITLIRTPKYEPLLDESDRGVTVSDDLVAGESFLEAVRITDLTVTLRTGSATYQLDISEIASQELREATAVLHKMNFDNAFELTLA